MGTHQPKYGSSRQKGKQSGRVVTISSSIMYTDYTLLCQKLVPSFLFQLLVYFHFCSFSISSFPPFPRQWNQQTLSDEFPLRSKMEVVGGMERRAEKGISRKTTGFLGTYLDFLFYNTNRSKLLKMHTAFTTPIIFPLYKY